jgi:hypothetical protein
MFPRTVFSGTEVRIDDVYSLNPDCSLTAPPKVVLAVKPQHGSARIEPGEGYPHYASNNQRYACNLKKTKALMVYYAPDRSYVGPDTLSLLITAENGMVVSYGFNIDVIARP